MRITRAPHRLITTQPSIILSSSIRTSAQLNLNLSSKTKTSPSPSPITASVQTRAISLPINTTPHNRHLPSLRRPSDLHTLLLSSSASSTLLLLLFTTSTCHACKTITPLLSDLITTRSSSPLDKFRSIAFAELELDSPDREDDATGGRGWSNMYDVGIEYGVRSVPVLMGFGGRRAERITERVGSERQLGDRAYMERWIDEVMQRGDPHGTGAGGAGESSAGGGGLFARIFGR